MRWRDTGRLECFFSALSGVNEYSVENCFLGGEANDVGDNIALIL